MHYESSKLYDGFSTVFRQWRADDTHCKFLHGYALSFRVTYTGDLDYRNWVFDFGGMKRAKNLIQGKKPKEWMDYMFDHTTIIAADDPELRKFQLFDELGIIQLRVLPTVGAESFSKYLFEELDVFVRQETNGRVRVKRVEVFENERNAAAYGH